MSLPSPILVVEDHESSAARFTRLLTGAGVPRDAIDVAPNAAGAYHCLARRLYRLALVDMVLPDGTGSALIREMLRLQPGLEAVVTSSFGSDDLVLEAIRAGASGYLMKDADDADLLWSLGCIERGGAPIHPGIARRLLLLAAAAPVALPPAPPAPRPAPAVAPEETAIDLTPRERDVLVLIAEGHTNKEVANKLSLSVHTIDFYAKRLYSKLAARTRTQAVSRARASGLLD
jgi:DNA-binding NarL/FixJ family response regulator